VAQLIDEEDIRCQWRQTGHVDAATTSQEVDALQAERQWLIQHGHQTAVWWSADAMRQRLGTPYYTGGLFDEQAWAFHPRQYGWGLALAARRHGARLFSRTPIIRVIQHPGPTYELVTGSGFSIQAKRVLWATNGYLLPGAHWLRGRIVPVYSAQIAVQLAEPSALPLDLPTVSDTSPEYHYFSRVGPDLVIFGGRLETHARRQGDFSPLEDQWRQLFPTVGSVRVTHRWAGRIALSQDFMPHIVQWAPGCWFAGGYTGHGAALSTEFGAIMATLATGGHVPGEVETLLKLPWRPLRFRRHWRPGARATIGDGRYAPLVRATIRV
jgi:gamma-glutamylputrescine oxidase